MQLRQNQLCHNNSSSINSIISIPIGTPLPPPPPMPPQNPKCQDSTDDISDKQIASRQSLCWRLTTGD
ncbi:MAG: hypothetical protein H0X30_33525 [Anaerolineae bacterium]|nr:hypothetical protein [Anaerolineae bacterium]